MPLRVTEACPGRFVRYVCPAGDPTSPEFLGEEGHTSRRVWYEGCKKPDCFHCNPEQKEKGQIIGGYGSLRARRTWDRKLEVLSRYTWWQFVFPLPEYYRNSATREKVRELRKRIQAKLSRFIRIHRGLLGQDVDLGMLECLHPAGDKRPHAWVPHFNFIVPAVALGWKNRRVLLPYRLTKKRQFQFTKPQLAELRDLWADAIGETFGIRPPVSDVFFNWKAGAKKQKHLLKYVLRSFPGWPAWTRRIYSYGFFDNREWTAYREYMAAEEPEPFAGEPTCTLCGRDLVRQEIKDQEFDPDRFGLQLVGEPRPPPPLRAVYR